MADKKEVSSIRYSIDGKKGKYTGTVNTGLLNNQPDGYGKIVFTNGDVIEGRFKNGAFIKGKAISSKGTVLEGEFDNLHFLSGKITFPNGDYITGATDSKTKQFKTTDFRKTYKFGEVIQGQYAYNDKTAPKIQAVITYPDGNTIAGEFAEVETPKEYYPLNFYLGTYACTKAQATFNLSQNSKIKAKLTGDITKYDYDSFAIKGVYEYDSGETYKIFEGDFVIRTMLYSDNPYNDSSYHNFSENFESHSDDAQDESKKNYEKAFKVKNLDYIYSILFERGSVLIKDNNGSFNGVKLGIEQANSNNYITESCIYKGTLTNKDNTTKITGEFDLMLNPLSGTVEILPHERFAATFKGKFSKTHKHNRDSFNTTFEGIFDSAKTHREGIFDGDIVLKRGANKMLNAMDVKLDFIKGSFTQVMLNGNTFDGKIYEPHSLEQELYNITQSSFAKDIYAIGTLCREDSKGNLIFNKHGLFDKNYNHLEGDVDEKRTFDDRTVHFVGNKTFNIEQNMFGYSGLLEYADNGDYYDGEFAEDFAFQKGKLREHYENGTIFTGATQDLQTYEGKLERKDDFWQSGDFALRDGEITFTKGNTLVYFDRPDKLYCFAQYDENGFENFDNYKYICNIKSNKNQKTNLIAANSISEAVVEYDYREKLENPALNGGAEVYTKEQMQKMLDSVAAKYEAQIAKMNNEKKAKERAISQGLGGIAVALHGIGDELEKEVQKRKDIQQLAKQQ